MSSKVLNKKPGFQLGSTFTQYLLWFSFLAVVLISVSSIWTFYNMNRLIAASQEQRDIALGRGLTIAVSDLIVTREYAQLESDLQQVISNVGVRSVLVSDLDGNVLAFLERATEGSAITANFSLRQINLPQDSAGDFTISRAGDLSVLWYRVNPGIPLGWIRMESVDSLGSVLVSNFRSNILISVFVLFLSLFAAAVTLVYRIKQKSYEKESQLISKNQSLYAAAHVDALTRLPNRQSLASLLEAAMIQSKENGGLLAICFLDLDEFKSVNDRLGHLSGDNLLIAAAGRMLRAVRENDSVIRLGGDEFVLLLGSIKSKIELDQLLARILELMASPFMIDGEHVAVSASIGATIYPIDTAPISGLLAHADSAMYEAKRKGGNGWALYRV